MWLVGAVSSHGTILGTASDDCAVRTDATKFFYAFVRSCRAGNRRAGISNFIGMDHNHFK